VDKPLGASHVAAVVIGATVGVGIFFTPANVARMLPSPAWIVALWTIGGLVAIAGAFVFSDLARKFPNAGGVYVFLREGLGPRTAFLYGWLQLLVIQPGAMGVIALVLVDHAAAVVGPLPRAACAIAAIASFTVANLVGLRTGGRIQLVMSGLKIAALAFVMILGLAPTAPHVEPTHHVAGWSWMILALIPIQFTFGGSYHGTYIGGSVRDPERSIPRGIVAAVLIVLVGYVGVNLAYLHLLGHDALAASSSPAADSASRAIGPMAGKIFAAIIVVSAAGILNTIGLGFPFVVHAMAKDGLFFSKAAELHPKTGRPNVAVATQGAIACVAVLAGAARIDSLLLGITFADAAFQAATAGVLLRWKRSSIAAWIFLVVEAVIAIACLAQHPRESAWGVGLLVLGVIVWAVWKRR
jgi:APA family basic amino acid/polyamine antiporter